MSRFCTIRTIITRLKPCGFPKCDFINYYRTNTNPLARVPPIYGTFSHRFTTLVVTMLYRRVSQEGKEIIKKISVHHRREADKHGAVALGKKCSLSGDSRASFTSESQIILHRLPRMKSQICVAVSKFVPATSRIHRSLNFTGLCAQILKCSLVDITLKLAWNCQKYSVVWPLQMLKHGVGTQSPAPVTPPPPVLKTVVLKSSIFIKYNTYFYFILSAQHMQEFKRPLSTSC